MREITYREAITEAMAEEMRRDSKVVIMGEDVGDFGGLTGTTIGLIVEFGSDRVMDMPIWNAVSSAPPSAPPCKESVLLSSWAWPT